MKRKSLKKLLKEFEYEQYAQNILLKLLENYPSFVEVLKEAKKAGVKEIQIGDHDPDADKPKMKLDAENKKVFVQLNGHYNE